MNAQNSFNSPAQLQDKIADINQTRALVARYLQFRKSDAIKLLQLNGINIENGASLKKVTAAFLQAIYSSDSFRGQASRALSEYALSGSKSFSGRQYRNATDDDPFGFNSMIDTDYSGETSSPSSNSTTATNSTTSGTTSSSSSSGGSFWDTLGGIFSKDVIQTGIKTGLGALSTNISSNANNTSQQNALAIEQAKLAQIQAAAALKATPDGSGGATGLSTGWKIAIGVVGLAIITTLIIVIARKK